MRDAIQRHISLHMDGLVITAYETRELMICLMERVLKTQEFPAAVLLQAGHSIFIIRKWTLHLLTIWTPFFRGGVHLRGPFTFTRLP